MAGGLEVAADASWRPDPEPLDRRRGIVRVDGHGFTDDGGRYWPLGMTLLHAVGTWHRGEELRVARNFKFIRKALCDYARILGQVGWPGQEIELWSDYQPTLGAVIDCAYDEGLKVQLTAIGGWAKAKPPTPGQGPLDMARAMVDVIAPRTHKVLMIEAVNEQNVNQETAIAVAKIFATLGLPFGVGFGDLRSDDEDSGITRLIELQKKAGATVSYLHTARTLGDASDPGGRTSRFVRQCWDFKHFPGIAVENEPPGIASSGNVFTDPERMAAKRAGDIICGAAAFCVHPGAGVTGKAGTGAWGTRHANLDEVPGLLEMAHMVKNAERHIPEGIEEWAPYNTNKPVILASGRADKIYGARDGGRFAEIIIGAEGVSSLKAVTAGAVNVVDCTKGEIVAELQADKDQVFPVPPLKDYVVIRT